jgi:hypothetical protein
MKSDLQHYFPGNGTPGYSLRLSLWTRIAAVIRMVCGG